MCSSKKPLCPDLPVRNDPGVLLPAWVLLTNTTFRINRKAPACHFCHEERVQLIKRQGRETNYNKHGTDAASPEGRQSPPTHVPAAPLLHLRGPLERSVLGLPERAQGSVRGASAWVICAES